MTVHGDIEATKFLKVKIRLLYIVLEEICPLLIGTKNIPTS